MKGLNLTFATLVVLLTFGCAKQFVKDNDISRACEGRHINEFVAKYGVPTNSYIDSSGNRVYVFYDADIQTSTDALYGKLGSSSTQLGSHITNVDTCTAYFETNSSGMIIRCRYEGNACE